MKKDMLGAVVRKVVDIPVEMLGVIYDLAEKLLGESGQEWLVELKRFLRKENCWTDEIVKTILEFVGTVAVTLTAGKFIAKDNFVVNVNKNARVKISYLGDNFRENFLGKIENLVGDISLAYHNLKESSRDIPIISELGGEELVETVLGVVFSLMCQQPNGEDGVLLNNGYANIFYVRDKSRVLWTVRVRWIGGGWFVDAGSVGYPYGWGGGGRVFSCNPSKSQS